MDSTPLENSNNPIASNAVYSLNQLVNTVGMNAANLSNSLSYNIVPRLEQLENNTIPIVTTSDNGKFLQVVNGAWTAVSITNGNEVAY